jgi:rRNA maturation RNase YbeY
MESSLIDVITFHLEDITEHPFPDLEDKYTKWLLSVCADEDKTLNSITYIFCSDEYLLDINIKYLGHDFYTDIITFPYKEGDEIESDLYISIDRVRENAEEFKVSFDEELKRVMVHGLLHLMGYGDKTEDDSKLMRSKEDFYIQRFGK